jgi:hypothetical protein
MSFSRMFSRAGFLGVLALVSAAAPSLGPRPGPTASPTPKGAAPATAPTRGAVSIIAPPDPVCVGWDGAWAVYRYSPAKREWLTWKSPATPLPRKGFPAVGPKAAVAIDPDARYSGWLFDLETHKWTQVPESPLVRDSVMDPIVVAFVGESLVVWGYTRPPLHGAVLNLKTMKWAPMAEAPIKRRFRAPYGVIGKKVIVWGGYFNHLQDGAVYDVERDAWEQMPAAPMLFSGGIARDVWRDRFLIFGGGRGHGAGALYDPTGRTWEQIEPAPLDVGIASACTISGDRLFLWSGDKTVKDNGAVYDLARKEWKKIAPSPLEPRQLSFAHAAANRVTVWGGWVSDTPARFFRDAAVYDLDTDRWEKLPDLPAELPYALHPGW